MRVLIIGASGFIGSHLIKECEARGWSVSGTTRATCNLLDLPDKFPSARAVFICAAMTRFIDCENDPRAYATNVDAPIRIAELCQGSNIIYLSSEAVERALHTNYGMHKALAEMGLRAESRPVIVRLSKVSNERVGECCKYLANLATAKPGLYRWL